MNRNQVNWKRANAVRPYRAIAALLLLSAFAAAPAQANSYSDITGTNIWNSVAPLLEDDRLDGDLRDRAEALNAEAQTVYNECAAAIRAAQPDPDAPRRYSREPVNVPPPPVPQSCRELEQLRQQAIDLRREVEELERIAAESALRTW